MDTKRIKYEKMYIKESESDAKIYKTNKKVYDKNSDPRYLINLNEGDTYNDPIFNQIKIISKNFNNNILNINIKSKSGLYVLKFKKA